MGRGGAGREGLTFFMASYLVLHQLSAKVGKAVDRNFVSDFDSTSREDVFR